MADNKNTIVVYADWISQFKNLTDEEAGKLIKHFFMYVNDLNPVSDRLTELLFEPIKQSLKRDLMKWEQKKVGRSDNGRLGNLKRWNSDLYDKVIANELTIEDAEIIANNRKQSHSDTLRQNSSQTVANIAVTDTVSVTVSATEILLEKEPKYNIIERKKIFYDALIPFTETYDNNMLREFYEYWTEHGEKDKKFRMEKEKTFGIERRLKTWSTNNFNKSNNGKSIIKNEQFGNLTSAIRESNPGI